MFITINMSTILMKLLLLGSIKTLWLLEFVVLIIYCKVWVSGRGSIIVESYFKCALVYSNMIFGKDKYPLL